MYLHDNYNVLYKSINGEIDIVATCNNIEAAKIATELMNKAARLNWKRKYTASARLFHKAEQASGFVYAN